MNTKECRICSSIMGALEKGVAILRRWNEMKCEFWTFSKLVKMSRALD